jgi:hypothetical protein
MSEGVLLKSAPSVVFQEVEGETVFLDLEGERYYVLDDVGTRCWQLLLEHGDLEQIIPTMLAEFDVDEQTLRSDLDALLAGLRDAHLVVPAESPH